MDSSRNAPPEVVTVSGGSAGPGAVPAGQVRVGCVRELIDAMGSLPMSADDASLIDELRALEELKSAIAGRQARAAVAFDLVRRQAQAQAGVPAVERGRGVAAQIALARRESPARGGRLLGLARALVTEMPHTMAALEAGRLNEWRATLMVRETACLSAADRCAVDDEVAVDAGTFDGAGDRALVAAVRAAAYRRDPRSVTERARRAAADRHVSLRPAPDTMTYLTALLPVAQGVAVHAELTRHADMERAKGDTRSRGQLMADALVERTTGTPGGFSRIEVQLIMTDRTLFQGESEPARLPGYGIVPAGWARDLLTQKNAGPPGQQAGQPAGHRAEHAPGQPTGRPGQGAGHMSGSEANPAADPAAAQAFQVWLRRLYTAPGTGELIAADSRARLFTTGQCRFLQARDHLCRTPYCDAPIRHYDHIIPWHTNGPTSLSNGAGLCEACNHTKELPGWTTTAPPSSLNPDPDSSPNAGAGPGSGARHALAISTPTGHTYHSTAPPLPGNGPNGRDHEQSAGSRAHPTHPPTSPSHAPDHASEDQGTPAYPSARRSRRAELLYA
ncbi:HNH endonuclease [Arthrobacter sp. TMS2-4]